MNKNRLLLDLSNNTIIFPESLPAGLTSSIPTSLKILSHLKPKLKEDVFLIHSVRAAAFHSLTKWPKVDKVQIFTISIEDINV